MATQLWDIKEEITIQWSAWIRRGKNWKLFSLCSGSGYKVKKLTRYLSTTLCHRLSSGNSCRVEN